MLLSFEVLTGLLYKIYYAIQYQTTQEGGLLKIVDAGSGWED